MLQPKRTKYRRPHATKYEGKAKGGTTVAFGKWGLQSCEGSYITNRQIEACRIALARYTKRAGQIWIRIFPHLGKTKKPLEVRMGSGKGNVESYVAIVKPGTIMFEIDGITEEQALEALRLGSHKLPVKCKVVCREKEGA